MKSDKPIIFFDTECYPNYFLLGITRLSDGVSIDIECYEGKQFDYKLALKIFNYYTPVGFNSHRYDIPLLALACAGYTPSQLKYWSDRIILAGEMPWLIEKTTNINISNFPNGIDLINVAPGIASLKTYGGRVNSLFLQDLPIDPSSKVSEREREILRKYCYNDREITKDLFVALKDQLKLRSNLGSKHRLNLISKSDQQIAEMVIGSEISNIIGGNPPKPDMKDCLKPFTYDFPNYISFETEILKNLVNSVKMTKFKVNDKGSVEVPESLTGLTIKIGENDYKLGIGGLHGSSKNKSYFASDDLLIVDRDVASYYPMIIINNKYYPKNLGLNFLKVYKSIVDSRLEAKVSNDKVTSDSLKITINGTYGKLGNKWSSFYSPKTLIQVTMTGQLTLLMLIEKLELAGIPVISANTDGLVLYCSKEKYQLLNKIVGDWEKVTSFSTSETLYKSIHCRDVNNYIAIYKDQKGSKLKYKGTGCFSKGSLSRNPSNNVCVSAVANFLANGTPLEKTIRECKNIADFVTIRQVKGGGFYKSNQGLDTDEKQKTDNYLGKVVRFYYAKNSDGEIRYVSNGNLVPRTKGCKPIMDFNVGFPGDIDYSWYVKECEDLIKNVGWLPDLNPEIGLLI